MIKYQKQELPYLHLLLFLQVSATFNMPKYVNKVMYTKLPDLLWNPIGELLALVTGNMSHGLYGKNHIQALYMVYRKAHSLLVCSKRFPKAFADCIIIHKNSYPKYYYRNNRQTFIVCKPGTWD